MQIIILNRKDFKVKDYCLLLDDFDIVTDLVTTQKSTFKVGKLDIKCDVGDFIYLKGHGYFGIIENADLDKTHKTISAIDFKEILKVEVIPQNFEGILSIYIEQLIRETLITNADDNQNMPFLEIERQSEKVGTLTFDEDKVMTISEVLEMINKMYGLTTHCDMIINHGQIKGISLKIRQVITGLTIRGDNLFLDDLVINTAQKKFVNKVVFIPKVANLFFKDTVTYYLLQDGSIGQVSADDNRFDEVVLKVQTYSDLDFLDLPIKARETLSLSPSDHQITFSYNKQTHSLKVLRDLELGNYVEFIYEGKIYQSIVAGMRFQRSLDVCYITLGEYRIKLTEKLQMLSDKVSSNIGNITIHNTGFTDLDGGEF